MHELGYLERALVGLGGADPVHLHWVCPSVVGAGFVGGSSSSIGFRWKGGTLTVLGVLPGTDRTFANAVSADGSTVVGTSSSDSFQQAFIWTDSNKMRTMIDELKARGFEPPVDLQLANVDFISDDGKTMVGMVHGSTLSFWRIVLQ